MADIKLPTSFLFPLAKKSLHLQQRVEAYETTPADATCESVAFSLGCKQWEQSLSLNETLFLNVNTRRINTSRHTRSRNSSGIDFVVIYLIAARQFEIA